MIRLTLLLTGLILLVPAASAADSRDLREQLRHHLEVRAAQESELAADPQLLAPQPLLALYEQRGWEPLWFDGGQAMDMLANLPTTLEMAARHGLDPDHYHRQHIADLLDAAEEQDAERRIPVQVAVELLATDALLTLAHHLAEGRIDPEALDAEWFIERERPEIIEVVIQHADGLLSGRQLLERLLPSHPGYHRLVERLELKRALQDNDSWGLLDSSPPLIRPGQEDDRVPAIRHRVEILEDLVAGQTLQDEEWRYDEELEDAIRQFQHRHGLTVDGVIGPRTLAALNVAPRLRVDQLRANLERWRWLPRTLGEEYILVNIAGFGMQVVSSGEEVMRQRVIVGQPYRRTPVFTGRMSYLVINPSWEVPHRLAVNDQLPRIRANPDYLEEMGFSVLRGWGAEERLIDPGEVDWQALSSRNFPYRLRQAPGPDNALGQVKFMFPNRHNVYLHDTPARGLFSLDERALSSGCIRLEDSRELARWLLTERADLMSNERMASTFSSGRETTIRLDRPLPVYLLYWTAWVDDDDQVHFRRDIYQRDQRLIEALNTPPPMPERQDLRPTGAPSP